MVTCTCFYVICACYQLIAHTSSGTTVEEHLRDAKVVTVTVLTYMQAIFALLLFTQGLLALQ